MSKIKYDLISEEYIDKVEKIDGKLIAEDLKYLFHRRPYLFMKINMSIGSMALLSYMYFARKTSGSIIMDITECSNTATEFIFDEIENRHCGDTTVVLRRTFELEKLKERDFLINSSIRTSRLSDIKNIKGVTSYRTY